MFEYGEGLLSFYIKDDRSTYKISVIKQFVDQFLVVLQVAVWQYCTEYNISFYTSKLQKNKSFSRVFSEFLQLLLVISKYLIQ